MSALEGIRRGLLRVYDEGEVASMMSAIEKLWQKHATVAGVTKDLSARDAVLITYGDQVYEGADSPRLATLREFLHDHLRDIVTIVHLLPFYPYSSDDGFSVVDYYEVRSDLGDWASIASFSESFDLMFDAVINHMSAESDWFKGFLNGDPLYRDFFIDGDRFEHLDQVTRPRTSPLLHDFDGRKVWTTFSRDQIDLNYASPAVFLQVLDLMLFYVANGARALRLDAIGFMWKEDGTSCMHLPQTHELIKVSRKVIEAIHPNTLFITETNVPHAENISYFGDGDEAQMVYNFTLPPLIAYSVLTGTTTKLQSWSRDLVDLPAGCCFFNFLASHDGIGLRPVSGILDEVELDVLLQAATEAGGQVSYRETPEGPSPYEINCNYLSLMGTASEEDLGMQRFLLAHSILLSFPGLPAIYFHSMFGCQNDLEGLKKKGYPRAINREKFDRNDLEALLAKEGTLNAKVFSALSHLIKMRRQAPQFHPMGHYTFPPVSDGLLAIERMAPNETAPLVAYFNLAPERQMVPVDGPRTDLLTNDSVHEQLRLEPYGFAWLIEGS